MAPDRDRIGEAIPWIAFLLGMLMIAGGVKGPAFEWPWAAILISAGSSLTAAALYSFIEAHFRAHPLRHLETSLDSIESMVRGIRGLPAGVKGLAMGLEHAPRLGELLQSAHKVRFYGPEGQGLLDKIRPIAAIRSTQAAPLEIELFLTTLDVRYEKGFVTIRDTPPPNTGNIAYMSQLNSSPIPRTRVRVHWLQKHVPTVAFLQIDDSFYQLDVLVPLVEPRDRPRLLLERETGDTYFKPLWQILLNMKA